MLTTFIILILFVYLKKIKILQKNLISCFFLFKKLSSLPEQKASYVI